MIMIYAGMTFFSIQIPVLRYYYPYLAGFLSVSSVFLANVNIVAKFRFRTSDANDA